MISDGFAFETMVIAIESPILLPFKMAVKPTNS